MLVGVGIGESFWKNNLASSIKLEDFIYPLTHTLHMSLQKYFMRRLQQHYLQCLTLENYPNSINKTMSKFVG